MSVPDTVRTELRQTLWARAASLRWISLSSADKSTLYDTWTKDKRIGGRLVRYIPQSQVRVYIKDTLLKDYTSSCLADHQRPFRALGVSATVAVVKSYTKPHGRRLQDGRVICWGRADDWKTILMALHERTFGDSHSQAHAAVFLYSRRKFHETHMRNPVEDAARKLCVTRVVWID